MENLLISEVVGNPMIEDHSQYNTKGGIQRSF